MCCDIVSLSVSDCGWLKKFVFLSINLLNQINSHLPKITNSTTKARLNRIDASAIIMSNMDITLHRCDQKYHLLSLELGIKKDKAQKKDYFFLWTRVVH